MMRLFLKTEDWRFYKHPYPSSPSVLKLKENTQSFLQVGTEDKKKKKEKTRKEKKKDSSCLVSVVPRGWEPLL